MIQHRIPLSILVVFVLSLSLLALFVGQGETHVEAEALSTATRFLQTAKPLAPPVSKNLFLPVIQVRCAMIEFLKDGGFEAGLPNPYWLTSSNVGSGILDNSNPPAPHSGSWKAWLGGDNLVQESVWQPITVPVGVSSLTVSYWWRVDTFETTHPFDTMNVRVRDVNSTTLQTLETISDGDAGSNYRQSVFTVSGAFVSQTLQIAFVAQTDSSRPTSFFVDDVSTRTACPP